MDSSVRIGYLPPNIGELKMSRFSLNDIHHYIPELTNYDGSLKDFSKIVLDLMHKYGAQAEISIHPTIDENAEVTITVPKKR